MSNVLSLHKPKPADDVVPMLRKLADDLEAGEVGFPVTTCLVVLGHTSADKPAEGDEWRQESYWLTYGFGARTDTFTVRGLMACALKGWES